MKPLYLPTDQLVVHQINSDNPTAKISLDKVTLSAPIAGNYVGADTNTRNTKINVKARKGKGFRDAQDVTFNRLDMAALFRNTNVFLDVNEPANSTDLLAALNRNYGLSLQETDIVPTDIAPWPTRCSPSSACPCFRSAPCCFRAGSCRCACSRCATWT